MRKLFHVNMSVWIVVAARDEEDAEDQARIEFVNGNLDQEPTPMLVRPCTDLNDLPPGWTSTTEPFGYNPYGMTVEELLTGKVPMQTATFTITGPKAAIDEARVRLSGIREIHGSETLREIGEED